MVGRLQHVTRGRAAIPWYAHDDDTIAITAYNHMATWVGGGLATLGRGRRSPPQTLYSICGAPKIHIRHGAQLGVGRSGLDGDAEGSYEISLRRRSSERVPQNSLITILVVLRDTEVSGLKDYVLGPAF